MFLKKTKKEKKRKKKKKRLIMKFERHKIVIFTIEHVRVENEIFLNNDKRILK